MYCGSVRETDSQLSVKTDETGSQGIDLLKDSGNVRICMQKL